MSRRGNSKRIGYVIAALLVATAAVGAVGAAMGATGGSADPRFGGGGHTGDPVTYASALYRLEEHRSRLRQLSRPRWMVWRDKFSEIWPGLTFRSSKRVPRRQAWLSP